MDFSTRLKEIREKNAMTQDDLAKILKITRQAVGNYEQGSRFPNDIELLTKIADIFDVSLDYLLGRINADIKADCVDSIDKIVIEHISEKKENYYTNRTMALRKLLMSVDDLPNETIDKIIQVIEILKDSLDK
ncbi:helix-turn-helix transcriptional regulator [Wukongibacter baidiensis]|uniref:helix-turn-helix domain-containing protein n=1 Tax=Wukongibacter baidiensis TaxID=1723361 RepID=UPI003D7F5ED1